MNNNDPWGGVFFRVGLVVLFVMCLNLLPDDNENFFNQAKEWIGNWIIENPVEFWGNVAVVAFIIIAVVVGKILWKLPE